MKTIKYIVAIFLFSSVLISCEKEFLEVLPRGQVIAKTTADFRKLLDYVDNSRYSYSLSLTMSFVDLLTDNVYFDSTKWNTYSTTLEHIKNLYVFKNTIWTYEAPTFTNEVNWNNQYYIVSLCSSILSEIVKATDNLTLQKQLIAETKVHRAYAYLLLVNLYAPHYSEANAANTKGVPIINSPASLPPLVRSSVKDVYSLIVSELESAIPDLPDDVNQFKHRPAKVSAYAILARTYLYMGNYAKAYEYANKALLIRSYLYDYNTIYTGTVDFYSNLVGVSRNTDEETLLWKAYAKNANTTTTNTYNILDTMTFNKLYPDFTRNPDGTYVTKDLRRTLKFNVIALNRKITSKTATYVFDFYNYRYKTDGSTGGSACHVPIQTAEMYLTRAECNARDGKLQEALNDVNAICMKRYKTGTFTALTPTDFQNNKDKVLERVLLERRRELYGRDLRLFDLKRLNESFSHYLGSLKIQVPANDPRMVWPIFKPYIDMNSELEQNDRSVTGVKYFNNLGVEVPITDN